MATVHFGRFTGPGGFARTVAVKRMHAHLCNDARFAAMFVDEARLASRVSHPNVAATLDVLATSDELLIVMEYLHGEPLGRLLRKRRDGPARVPPGIASAIACDVLEGLHAAHEATDEDGHPLGIVHRDVSPDNVLVGADGTSRVLDFGVAKAVRRLQVTREGLVKGKIAYMAPEQVRGEPLERTADVYAASVVLWEMLTGEPLFAGERDADVVEKILYGIVDAPTAIVASVPEALNEVVLRGLSRDPRRRFATARDMVHAVRSALRPAAAAEVSDWVESVAGSTLAARASALVAIERGDVTRPRADAGRPSAGAGGATGAHDDDDAPTAMLSRPPRRPRRPRAPWVVVAASVLASGMLAAVALSSRTVDSRPSRARSPGSNEPPPPGAAPSAIDLADGATRPAESAAIDSLTPGVSTVRKPRTPAKPSRRGDCEPPYTTDTEGTRHYKLECL